MAGTPTQIQLRRDTAANWALSNPVLASGELGVDTTNNQSRIGDGVTAWLSLKASVDSIATAASAISPAIPSASVRLANYARSRAAYAAVKAGTGDMKIVLVGDSTMAGAYASGAANASDYCRPISQTAWFASALHTADVPVTDSAWCGDQNCSGGGGTVDNYDVQRIATLQANWNSTNATNVLTLGGNAIRADSGSTSFQFRPFDPVSRMELYYRIDTGLSSNWTISRSGDSTLSGLSSAGTAAVGKAIFNGALGVQIFSAQRVAGGLGLYLLAADCYDSSHKSVRVFNAGWSSGRVSDWQGAGSPWSPQNMLTQSWGLQPDLVVIQPGINDYHLAGDQTGSPSATVGGNFPATYQANLDAYVVSLRTAGVDVMLRTHFPTQNSVHNLTMQKAYRDATIAVALKYSLVVDDLWGRIGSWERAGLNGAALTSNPGPMRSWMSDSLHPGAELYRRAGESGAALVRAVMTA